jgi:hypothetical protein
MAIMAYRPMTITALAERLMRDHDPGVRWKHVWEFLEEYRWEPADRQHALLIEEPAPIGDQRWDVLLAAIAEHLAAQRDAAPPAWTRSRFLVTPWFPSTLPSKRMEALTLAPAAFRKDGVYLSVRDLEAA